MRRVASAATLLVLLARVAAAGTPAPGWTDTLAANGFTAPTAMAFLPGQPATTFLVVEKGGAVKRSDAGVVTTLGTIPVCNNAEMGLLGVAVDPAFATNGFVYLYRTENDGGCASATDRSNEIVRVTLSPTVANLTVLLTGMRTINGNHDGGGLLVGPDGKLWAGVGDTGQGDNVGCPGSSTNPYSQDLGALEGKLVRLELDGTIPADNPFVGVAGARAEIWAYGFRNPFRFGFDPVTGKTWLADVGDRAVEEIDVMTAGGNYGWPHCEGTLPLACEQAGDVDPIYEYSHNGTCTDESTLPPSLGTSITGGTFVDVDGTVDYFFGDYTGGAVYRATVNGTRDGIVGTPAAVSTNAQGPVDLVTGPDGALYYVAITAGAVRRLAPIVVANDQPLFGRSVSLRDNPDPTRRSFTVQSRDPSIGLGQGNGSADDPVLHGGSVRIRTSDGCGGPCDATYPLPNDPPNEGWSYVGHPGENRGYKFRSRLTRFRASVRPAREVSAGGRGTLGHALAADPAPVDVTVTTGDRRYCMEFGGLTSFTVGKSFGGKNAPAPAACLP